MVKDRIGNVLGKSDRVFVVLPESQIGGYVYEVKEQSIVRGIRGGQAEMTPGHVAVNCIIMLPVDPETGMVAQCVKVHDPNKVDEPESKLLVHPN